MKVEEVADKMNLVVYCGEKDMQVDVSGGYVSDLLSDVMGNAQEGNIWITLQSHMNIVAIASLKDLAGIILVNGIKPSEQVMEKATEENIPLLGTDDPTFKSAGKLYNLLTENESIHG